MPITQKNSKEDIIKTSFEILKEEGIENIKRFHLKMWMFTHGISCLVATGTCEFSDEEISSLLTEEFKALISSIIK